MDTPKLLSLQEAADGIGVSRATAEAWANRAIDPLPTIVVGKGTGKRVFRKVVMAEVDAWLERNSSGGKE